MHAVVRELGGDVARRTRREDDLRGNRENAGELGVKRVGEEDRKVFEFGGESVGGLDKITRNGDNVGCRIECKDLEIGKKKAGVGESRKDFEIWKKIIERKNQSGVLGSKEMIDLRAEKSSICGTESARVGGIRNCEKERKEMWSDVGIQRASNIGKQTNKNPWIDTKIKDSGQNSFADLDDGKLELKKENKNSQNTCAEVEFKYNRQLELKSSVVEKDNRQNSNAELGIEENYKSGVGIDSQNDRNVGVNEGLTTGGNGYHSVKVDNLVELSQMRDSILKVNKDLQNDLSVNEVDSRTLNISQSDNVNIDCRDNSVKVEGQSKYLEMIKRRTVKSHFNFDSDISENNLKVSDDNKSQTNENNVRTTNNDITNDLSMNININNQENVDYMNVESKIDPNNANTSDINKSVVEKKISKNIHRSLSKEIDYLQYLYYQEAENFWNSTNYRSSSSNTNEDTLSVNSDYSINTADSETVNDLAVQFKDCYIDNELEEHKKYTHNNNLKQEKIDDFNTKDDKNFKKRDTVNDFDSVDDDKHRKTKTYYIHPHAGKIFERVPNKPPLTYHRMDHSESSNVSARLSQHTNMYDDINKETESKLSKRLDRYTSHRHITANESKASTCDAKNGNLRKYDTNTDKHDSKRVTYEYSTEKNGLNKENVTTNVKTDSKDLKVKIDDGKCIRSAVLLRKLEITKKT